MYSLDYSSLENSLHGLGNVSPPLLFHWLSMERSMDTLGGAGDLGRRPTIPIFVWHSHGIYGAAAAPAHHETIFSFPSKA